MVRSGCVGADAGPPSAAVSLNPRAAAGEEEGRVAGRTGTVRDGQTVAVDLSPPPRRVKYRRTWPQRFVLVIGLALITGCLYGAWYISDIKETFGDIPRVAVSPGVLAEVGDIKFDARNILIMGWTDSGGNPVG